MNLPTFSDIEDAYLRIEAQTHITPVLTSRAIDKITGAEIFFKCENFQKVGAFKFRGACNAVFALNAEELASGVATHSSGNHAAALALAAQLRQTQAHIVMPQNAPEIKKKAVVSYGGLITFCEPTLQAREETLQKILEQTGAQMIHPYDQKEVIAGQGTCALELIQQQDDLDAIVTPVGGGGLLAGTSITAKYINPEMEVIGAEPQGADDAAQSFQKKQRMPSLHPNTIADGLLTALGKLNYELIIKNVDDIITTPDSTTIEAMRLIWERMKIIVEPSSAVSLAVILDNKEAFKGKKVGVVLSGGNVDLQHLPF
ncbi:pyridoxal-phosphate dependent enzyme [Saccharicrinis fermentans]|uniref:Phenylserine dehydratase n=1 Tax=Saccharicrinis fermentans DSM 9555 = JCM 21142 TaxID=869213 RepID=W7XWW2_9BACT|nr:pyridoxal-phosphate dependent enzyme [Saccharicrinis fermentans]GAF02885.1 phenylserine dehydratase [Saccharicrinis fermentans DSM 9555 = JCM 21142]